MIISSWSDVQLRYILLMVLFIIVSRKCGEVFLVSIDRVFFRTKQDHRIARRGRRPNKLVSDRIKRLVCTVKWEVVIARFLRLMKTFFASVHRSTAQYKQSHKHGQTHNPTSKIQNRQRGIWKQHMSSPVPFDLA